MHVGLSCTCIHWVGVRVCLHVCPPACVCVYVCVRLPTHAHVSGRAYGGCLPEVIDYTLPSLRSSQVWAPQHPQPSASTCAHALCAFLAYPLQLFRYQV